MGKGKPRSKVVPGGQLPVAGRQPRSVEAVGIPAGKRPRRAFTPQVPDGKLIILFGRVDVDGPWCLTKITVADHLTLLKRISGFESMAAHQVFDGKVGKDYDIDDLPSKAAKDRLMELELDDVDQISRLQIGGKQRLYGFRDGQRFYVIWWDPEHEVYPSVKKHT